LILKNNLQTKKHYSLVFILQIKNKSYVKHKISICTTSHVLPKFKYIHRVWFNSFHVIFAQSKFNCSVQQILILPNVHLKLLIFIYFNIIIIIIL